jgi:DNA-binding HxlR family transcriptional regulator
MSNVPYPGKPVRGSKTGKPMMAIFDLLGRPWAMGVLWQLCQGGACTFRELQLRCESISPAVLNSRLKDLRTALLVERSGEGYQPTALGIQLVGLLKPFGAFSQQWADELARETAEPTDGEEQNG